MCIRDSISKDGSISHDLLSLCSSSCSHVRNSGSPFGSSSIKGSLEIFLELLNSGFEGVALRIVALMLVVLFVTELSEENWLLLTKFWVSDLRDCVSALDNVILQLGDLILQVLGQGS